MEEWSGYVLFCLMSAQSTKKDESVDRGEQAEQGA